VDDRIIDQIWNKIDLIQKRIWISFLTTKLTFHTIN
jgi:hypothetical protein